MAGSWNHMVNPDGTPYGGDTYGVPNLLENGGDVIDALEQCYGMIWYLAREVALLRPAATRNTRRESIAYEIEFAQRNYLQGVRLGKGEAE